VSASDHHISVARCRRRRGAAAPCLGGGAYRLRWLLRRVADDDRDAFGELFHRVSGPVSSRVRRQVPDPIRAAGVVAGTFVEVWWLAGCHVDPDTEVMAWINNIVRRRVADSWPLALPAADPVVVASAAITALWVQRLEVELAALLKQRTAPSSTT
jgi:DNA-directed RNA polymerase specialized sigma24 family protein